MLPITFDRICRSRRYPIPDEERRESEFAVLGEQHEGFNLAGSLYLYAHLRRPEALSPTLNVIPNLLDILDHLASVRFIAHLEH